MDKMCVFRVEDAQGRGFYRGPWFEMHMRLLDGNDSIAHPTPYADSQYGISEDARKERDPEHWIGKQVFGFVSLDQLRRWFYNDTWLQGMHPSMRISVYECPADDPVIGRTQCTFTRGKAKLIQQCEPAQLLEAWPQWYTPDVQPAIANESE